MVRLCELHATAVHSAAARAGGESDYEKEDKFRFQTVRCNMHEPERMYRVILHWLLRQIPFFSPLTCQPLLVIRSHIPRDAAAATQCAHCRRLEDKLQSAFSSRKKTDKMSPNHISPPRCWGLLQKCACVSTVKHAKNGVAAVANEWSERPAQEE